MQILGQAIHTFKQLLSQAASGKNTGIYLRTGFNTLDKLAGGYLRGEMAVVAGRPGMGVTSFLLESAVNMAQNYGYRGVYISVDHSETLIQAKLTSILTNIPTKKLLDEKYYGENIDKINISDDQAALPLYIHVQPNHLWNDIQQEITALHQQQPLDFMMLDVVQNIQLADHKQFRSAFDHFNEMLLQLTAFSREHHLALICGSRLSRKVEDRGGCKIPILSDISISGLLEEKAEKVLFLYRPEYYGIEHDEHGVRINGTMKVIVAKNVSGPTGEITLFAGEHRNHPFRVVDPSSDDQYLKKYIFEEDEEEDDEYDDDDLF